MNRNAKKSSKEKSLHPPLTKEEATEKNMCLKRRRDLNEEGVPREKLKFRNLSYSTTARKSKSKQGLGCWHQHLTRIHQYSVTECNKSREPEAKIKTSKCNCSVTVQHNMPV